MNRRTRSRFLPIAAILLLAGLCLVWAWTEPAAAVEPHAPAATPAPVTIYADADATTKTWLPASNLGGETTLHILYSTIDEARGAWTLVINYHLPVTAASTATASPTASPTPASTATPSFTPTPTATPTRMPMVTASPHRPALGATCR
jgi:hypothetical protein